MKRFDMPTYGMLCTLMIISMAFGGSFAWAQEPKEVSIGWESWGSYQYIDEQEQLTGLDIELISAVLQNMNCTVTFKEMPWKRHLLEVEKGTIDIATGASKTPEREEYAYFSDPYRTEAVVLYVRKEDAGKYTFKTLEDIIGTSFRLGVTRGYYYGENYETLIQNPDFQKNASTVEYDTQNYKKLMANRIDGFLGDPVASTAGLREEGILNSVDILMEIYSDNIFVMLSKKSLSPEFVQEFNASLAELKADGTYEEILNKYLK